MKVVIFAGGMGSRISEESHLKPKPMIEVGGKPMLWHVMKIYSHYGHNEFVVCLGYKGYLIKEYFMNYFMHNSDITIDLKNNESTIHDTNSENFKVTLVDTGYSTNTAGRLKKVKKYVEDGDFMLTYGDGVADVNLDELVKFHQEKKVLTTMTAIQPGSRFGNMHIDDESIVHDFIEKPKESGNWINGGFFILSPGIFDYLDYDVENVQWEQGPLCKIAEDGKVAAYKHHGFWKCMDTVRDKEELEEYWMDDPKWKVW
ncbi:glucose-1-phosphate cytidylyltransferase [bacterium AH-315-C07]|nr:glucose-1-phosphate cytidylyltransferase [bacterium AH-315-C07]